MNRRRALLAALFLALSACGDDTTAGTEEEDSTPKGTEEPTAKAVDAEAPEDEPAAETAPQSRTGKVGDSCDPFEARKTCGHWDGPLRAERTTFHGLIKSPKDIHFRDGRTLKGYQRRPGRVQSYTIGEASFDQSEYFFDRRRLRLHRIHRVGMSPAECEKATLGIKKVFGEPLVDKAGEKMWRLEWIEVRWRDTARDGSKPDASRCQVEYRDREWFAYH